MFRDWVIDGGGQWLNWRTHRRPNLDHQDRRSGWRDTRNFLGKWSLDFNGQGSSVHISIGWRLSVGLSPSSGTHLPCSMVFPTYLENPFPSYYDCESTLGFFLLNWRVPDLLILPSILGRPVEMDGEGNTLKKLPYYRGETEPRIEFV